MTQPVEPRQRKLRPSQQYQGSMAGHFLLALPTIDDERFERAVIYITEHTPEGAAGLVINHPAYNLSFADMFSQLKIDMNFAATDRLQDMPVLRGGPVDLERGFILHTPDARFTDSQPLLGAQGQPLAISNALADLNKIACGVIPDRFLFALGYSGWGAGQLDAELRDNIWLSVPADIDLLFAKATLHKWDSAMQLLGVNPAMLSESGGNA